MTTYAIGDVQGCFDELEQLLAHIQFNSAKDILWFTGDLVNRGPKSLAVLRFIKSLANKQVCILGNHDLHLIASAYGVRKIKSNDTMDEILSAPDKIELIEWLRHQPLLHHDKELGFVMVHAGLAPSWSLKQAKLLAAEAETALRSDSPQFFLEHMYGDKPNKWDDNLEGIERLRCIVNYLTRMRFCHIDGSLNLEYKGEIAGKSDDLIPWYDIKDRANANEKIIIGHWAALNGKTDVPNVFPLDTGCVWGNALTAMRLEDTVRFSIKCG